MKSDLKLCVGFDQAALSLGVKIPVYLDFASAPHMLIAAPSGSGKTYLLTFLLEQLAAKPVTLLLADFKGIDFIEMDGCSHYYRHSAVADAVQFTFDTLQDRMKNPRRENEPVYLCIDEWSGFLSLYPKKEQEDYKQKMASILMLGRGCGVFVILALQRADASYITGRDNMGNALGLGRLSAESARMLFPDDTDKIQPKGRGRGYLRTDGKPLREIVVPRLRSIESAHQLICKKLN